jgi:hypothetical protein
MMYITAIQGQFVGNLIVGQVQSHEVEAQDPHLGGGAAFV